MNEREDLELLFDTLFPICRSIMGEGYRRSLEILSSRIPLENLDFKTGEKVLNWEVPDEWVIREAWIEDESGTKIVDFKNNNLHVMSYSEPVDAVLNLEELKKHVYTVPWQKEAIPYTTSYYKKRWGFCMSQNQLDSLKEGKYHAYIDSEFIKGTLRVGQTLLEGESKKEVVLTSYLCHPSMANNELSGPLVLTMLYKRIQRWPRRNLSYRFVINPETIGTIAYLSRYGTYFKEHMYAGMVLNCMGGNDSLHYKASRRGDSPLDKVIQHLNAKGELICPVTPFFPTTGSDERQYCSPGFNLPYGQMSKVMYYKEYHSSLDTKEFMGMDHVLKSIDEVEKILIALDYEGYYVNKYPYGEIKLDQYHLYPDINAPGAVQDRGWIEDILVILNYSDGEHSLSEIAAATHASILGLIPIINLLKDRGLIEGPYYVRGEKRV